MISEFTHAINSGEFFTRDLDDIRVKGKNEPVESFRRNATRFFTN